MKRPLACSLPRRSLLRGLSLGASSLVLGPLAGRLVAEAQAAPAPKRVIFVLTGNGVSASLTFSPPELRDDRPIPGGTTQYTWPEMFAPLARHRSRMLLVDGLSNAVRTTQGHTGGYGALSCRTVDDPSLPKNGTPDHAVGISIDEYIAEHLGATTPLRAVRWGLHRRSADYGNRLFAKGPKDPIPHVTNPALLMKELFGSVGAETGGDPSVRRRLLLDAMTADIKRLQARLAGPERDKLGFTLTALEEMDRRLSSTPVITSCKRPARALPAASAPTEDRMEAMLDLSLAALVCGMTNVVGIGLGTGDSHGSFCKYTRIAKGTPFEAAGSVDHEGHSPDATARAARTLYHQYHATLLARIVDTLSAVPEGNGTLFDNTVIVYMSDNGDAHHSRKSRWPLAIIGNAGGAIRADGRFLRYPGKGSAGGRSVADLFCSLATAVGRPTKDFGAGPLGNEPVQGPLAEIMA